MPPDPAPAGRIVEGVTGPRQQLALIPGGGLSIAYGSFLALSCGDALVKSLAGRVPVFEIAFISATTTFGVIALFPPRGERRTNLFRARYPLLILGRTACVTAMAVFSIYAFTTIPFAQVYSLLFLSPTYIALLSLLLLHEPVQWRQTLAIAVGFIGVLLVVKPGFRELHLGHLAAAIVPLAGALNVIILRRIGGNERQTSLLGIPMLGAAVATGVLSLAAGFSVPATHEVGRLVLVGILVAAGHTGILLALRRSAAAVVGTAHYSQMVWALGFATLLFHEPPDMVSVIGIVVIVFSGLATLLLGQRATST